MDVHRFNPSATSILGLLDGSATLDELAVDISDVFGQPPEEVRAQLDELIHQLDEGNSPGARVTDDETGVVTREREELVDERELVRERKPRGS